VLDQAWVEYRRVRGWRCGVCQRSSNLCEPQGATPLVRPVEPADLYDDDVNAPVEIRQFIVEDTTAICALCQAEGWDYWDDPDRAARALGAPGVTTLVAEHGDELLGAVQVITDGQINWVVGLMIVAPAARHEGLGTRLLDAVFETTGAKRLDLQTEDDGPRFYRQFPGREMVAFRLYPSTPGKPH